MKPFLSFLPSISLPLIVAGLALACGGKAETSPLGNASSSSSGGSSGGAPGAPGGNGGGGGQCTLAPACDAGDQQVKAQSDCAFSKRCYARTACGATIWCGSGDACTTPACSTGYAPSPTCAPPLDCRQVSGCGGKVSVTCEACMEKPACDPGDTEVATEAQCPQDDVRCYRRFGCIGGAFWCWGPMK